MPFPLTAAILVGRHSKTPVLAKYEERCPRTVFFFRFFYIIGVFFLIFAVNFFDFFVSSFFAVNSGIPCIFEI